MKHKIMTLATLFAVATLALGGAAYAASGHRLSPNSNARNVPHASSHLVLCENVLREKMRRLTVTRNTPPNPTIFAFPRKTSGTDPTLIRALALALCKLPVIPKEAMSCPDDLGIRYTLHFTNTGDIGGTSTKDVVVAPTGCETVTGLGATRWVLTRLGFWSALGKSIGLQDATRSTFVGDFTK